jgi:hypothetical protein
VVADSLAPTDAAITYILKEVLTLTIRDIALLVGVLNSVCRALSM